MGLKYDPSTGDLHDVIFYLYGGNKETSISGIFGMDFYVILIRPGYRVARRKIKPGKIGIKHKVSKDDAIAWFQQKYEGIVL